MQAKLNELLLVVEKEIKKAERNYLEAKKNASEVAASAAASPSQSGDRFHSQGTADIAKLRLEALKNLKLEIEEDRVVSSHNKGEEVFLVKNITLVPGFRLVSLDSPVGKELSRSVE